MRTDGRTDMTELIVAFHNFAKAPDNSVRKLARSTWQPVWNAVKDFRVMLTF
jgi:hypothetical protein